MLYWATNPLTILQIWRILKVVSRREVSPINLAVGKRIKEFRRKAALTQKDLAQKTQINRTSLALIEKGIQSIPIDKLCAVALYTNVTVTDLLPKNEEIVELLPKKTLYKDLSFDNSRGDLDDSDFDIVVRLRNKNQAGET